MHSGQDLDDGLPSCIFEDHCHFVIMIFVIQIMTSDDVHL